METAQQMVLAAGMPLWYWIMIVVLAAIIVVGIAMRKKEA